jgi:hypothetical protein
LFGRSEIHYSDKHNHHNLDLPLFISLPPFHIFKMALNALFVSSSTIGVTTFLAGLFADKTPKTNVRIAAGLDGWTQQNTVGALSGAGGKVSQITTYNGNMQLLGNAGTVGIKNDGYTDTGIEQPNQEQVQFVEIHSDSHAVCIAYVSTTWVDGSKYMWVGDWGNPCGLNWYYSGVIVSVAS